MRAGGHDRFCHGAPDRIGDRALAGLAVIGGTLTIAIAPCPARLESRAGGR